MKTATATAAVVNEYIAAEVIFGFENGVTKDDLAKIQRKVTKHCSTSYFPAVAVYFVGANQVRVVITYERGLHNPFYTKDGFYDSVGARLTRMIDAHDDVATFEWSY